MLIEIALGEDLSLNIVGHSKINRRQIALRFRCAQIARKSAENQPKITSFLQLALDTFAQKI